MTIIVRAKATDPQTSQDAAAALTENQADRQATIDLIVRIFAKHGPLADFEMAPLFLAERPESTAHHPAVARDLARKEGLVRDTGRTKVNPASSCKGMVWEFGRDDEYLARTPLGRCPTCGKRR